MHYDGDSQALTISRRSVGHEICAQFPSKILAMMETNHKDFLSEYRNDGQYFIHATESANVHFTSVGRKKSSRSPNGSLVHGNDVPFLMYEFTTEENIIDCVEDYLIGIEGKVRTVIIVKPIQHTKRKRGTTGGGVEETEPELPEFDGAIEYALLYPMYTYTCIPNMDSNDPEAEGRFVTYRHEMEEFWPHSTATKFTIS
ncbi:hypothetical protein Q9L58_009497 [Maublancomyces gigas]|uniref:Uncharacterized protein n=1 Tax=Discina gigas TaxID=1032678 RepID=A0ABR3G6R2_9PEZI